MLARSSEVTLLSIASRVVDCSAETVIASDDRRGPELKAERGRGQRHDLGRGRETQGRRREPRRRPDRLAALADQVPSAAVVTDSLTSLRVTRHDRTWTDAPVASTTTPLTASAGAGVCASTRARRKAIMRPGSP